MCFWKPPPFAIQDQQLLAKRFSVTITTLPWHPLRLLRQLAKSDICVCWFADVHSAIAVGISRALRKPSIVIAGGYDVARVPEIHYGALLYSPITRLSAMYALRRADRVLVVDRMLALEAETNMGVETSKIRYVPTGYDSEFWKPIPGTEREATVITVATVDDSTIRLKGLEFYARIAAIVREASFVIAGKATPKAMESLTHLAQGNIRFTGQVSQEVLLGMFRRAGVYCQLSRHEGLPNSLCEAMLCGCVPVGTRAGGIPTAIGDAGSYIEFGDAIAGADAVRKALRAPSASREKARERISKMFPIQRRERELAAQVLELAGK